MIEHTDIAVIGAGPYGLSLAAHLEARHADFRIFGVPMQVWRDAMPEGMFLKSEGFATDLFDPARSLTLRRFSEEQGAPYADIGVPVSREQFIAYGLAFQQRLVPSLEATGVAHLRRSGSGFHLTLANGREFEARKVVVATGISHYEHLPDELAALPSALVRHTSRPLAASEAQGKTIAVFGAGSSAIDAAGLLRQAGASVALYTRRDKIWFNNPPVHESGMSRAMKKVTKPRSGLGLGWRSKLACDMPIVFHHMPTHFRHRVTRGHLGPSAGWIARNMVEGHVPLHLGTRLVRAEEVSGAARLTLEAADGTRIETQVDQVVAGTGYRVDLRRLPFLDPALADLIAVEGMTPKLDRTFGCSVPGLHFTGVTAANSFGPVLRFAYGARFAAPKLARHLAG